MGKETAEKPLVVIVVKNGVVYDVLSSEETVPTTYCLIDHDTQEVECYLTTQVENLSQYVQREAKTSTR